MNDIRQYFATTSNEATERYELHKSIDPFPDIAPALLSSSQVQAYIAKTGMIFPYFPEADPKKERMSSASLTMTIGPEILYWDSDGKQQYRNDLRDNDEIMLRPNSITFLRPTERFNVPDYIAIRFNLRIKHVHRGLLLGTGPIIDPGFKGYPMVPVHNLTENEYIVCVGEEFINVEFTKIIHNRYFNNEFNLPFEYINNKGKTFDYNFPEYIIKNVPYRRVKSSLSGSLDKASKLIEETQHKLERFSIIGIITIILTVAGVIYGGYQLILSTVALTREVREKLDRDTTSTHIFNTNMTRMQIEKYQESKIMEIQNDIEKLNKEIKSLKKDLKMNPSKKD